MEPREKRILVHPSGVEFTVFLSEYEIERAERDQQFLEDMTQKYYELYMNNLVSSRASSNVSIEGTSTLYEPEYAESVLIEASAEVQVLTEDLQTSQESQLSSQDSTEGNQGEEKDISIWVIRGRETDDDREATKYLLRLRGSERFRKKFDDKKSVKLQLWKDIAEEMHTAGFSVGRGRVGAKRCQQKFSNLYKVYVGFLKHVAQTGGEKKQPPEYYADMHNILGGKDKIFPQCTFDAEKGLAGPSNLKVHSIAGPLDEAGPSNVTEQSNVQTSFIRQLPNEPDLNDSNIENETQSQQNTPTGKKDRFKDVPGKLKPAKNDEIIAAIRSIHQESVETQQDQFNKIINLITEQNSLLREQNSQRDRLIDILASSRKKRKHHSDTDSD